MRTIQEQFGTRVRELRKKRGWTQEQLAEAAGRHWTYIGGIERGERNVTLPVVGDIARALDVDTGELFRGLGNPKTKG
jgi:transcriptional regulator with XRE-family HTH domain